MEAPYLQKIHVSSCDNSCLYNEIITLQAINYNNSVHNEVKK